MATEPETNTNSFFNSSFSFTIKTLLPSICIIFGSGFGLGVFITSQTDKIEIQELKLENSQKLQVEVEKCNELRVDYYSKKVEELNGVVNEIKKGGASGK